MKPKNSVFIATSLDGYITDKNGGIDWLHSIPNPENDDMGYASFIDTIDALVMGRKTFETICSFNIPWPYEKPVFILSTTLTTLPHDYTDKAFLIKGAIPEVLKTIHQQGHQRLYIDGGSTINNFLKKDFIDEMIITTLPILLGGGTRLFGNLPNLLEFELVGSKTYLNEVPQTHYRRNR